MKLSTAVAMRVTNILLERKISQYRLEKLSTIPRSTMRSLMKETNKSVNLTTIMLIIRALNMTTSEFFDDPLFENPDLELD